jgi:hypothetical protein
MPYKYSQSTGLEVVLPPPVVYPLRTQHPWGLLNSSPANLSVNQLCIEYVDSHGQACGTKTYTRCANYKRIRPRLKAWSSVGLAFFVGSSTRAQRA